MIRKDKIFVLILLLWITSAIINLFLYGVVEAQIVTMKWVLVLAVIVLFKMYNKKFNNWLESE